MSNCGLTIVSNKTPLSLSVNGCKSLTINNSSKKLVIQQAGILLFTGAGGLRALPNHIPAGLINGSNNIFTTSRPWVFGGLLVYLNGIRQTPISHFNQIGPDTFEMSDAPVPGDILMVDIYY